MTTKYSVLNDAYQQIFVQSKKCFIATHCLGARSTETNILRDFKNILVQSDFGLGFVRWYYLFSPKLISYFERNPKVDRIAQPLISIPLKAFATILKYCIFKR